MKIIQYSQHVLGMGHFFRSREIAAGLSAKGNNQVILASGGTAVDMPLPNNVRCMNMPALVMDNSFLGFFNPDGRDVEEVQQERTAMLFDLFEKERPDVFLVELFPFGRKKFRFELLPLLQAIKGGRFGEIKVICSLRDILVERDDQEKYENRVLETLNKYFHAVIVHSDPQVIRLEQTFPALDRLDIPLKYSGYVASPAPSKDRFALRSELGIPADYPYILVSAGAGSVGGPLMRAAAEAFQHLIEEYPKARMKMFTGPGLDEDSYSMLRRAEIHGLEVQRFTPCLPDHMAACDLSISMAGYNTTMNILASRVPALVLPFNANREQTLRAQLLEKRGLLAVLSPQNLDPARLCSRMRSMLDDEKRPAGPCPDLKGADATRILIERLF